MGTNGNTACVVSSNATCLSLTFSSGYTNTITINNLTQISISGNFTDNTAHGWTVTGSGALTINAASTITSGGKTFPGAVTFSGANTKTLSGDWTITGTLTCQTGNTVINSNILNIGGSLTFPTVTISGTTKLVMNGTGTITSGGAPGLANSMDINTSGTITIATNFNYGSGTLKYVSGTIVGGAAPGLSIASSCTLDLAGVTWPLVTFPVTGVTVALSSLLRATTLSFTTSGTATITFAGSFGWTCNTFSSTNSGFTTVSLLNTNIYTIIDSFTAVSAIPLSSASNKPLFTSDDATLRAALILLNDSSTCNVTANFTRINAGGGRPINSFNGIITDCINVSTFSNVLFKPTTSFDRGSKRFGLTNKNKSVIYQ